jgi:hypothetical protein
MFKEKMLSASILCLAISLIISASIVTRGMKSNGEYVRTGLGNIGSSISNISTNLNPNNYNSGIPKDKAYNLSNRAFAIYEGYLVYYRISKDVDKLRMMLKDLIEIYEDFKELEK